ncbi:MAG: hypothetical protein AB7S26_05410 [Sandaracinaceae bacterium]
MMRPTRVLALALSLVACDDGASDTDAGFDAGRTATDAGARDAARADSGGVDAATDPDAGTPDAGPPPCPTGALCESFDDYTETAITDGQTFGPWRATVRDPGAAMDLDGTHTTSGAHALHVRIEQGVTAGGRLFARDAVPLIAAHPTHLYGRMQMYVDPGGTSVHWTFFGEQGPADSTSPAAGRPASYIMSALLSSGMNRFSFVDGLSGGANYQDCWNRSSADIEVGRWMCVTFEMDSVARHLVMGLDGTQIAQVDETGQGCVSPTPGTSPWYGPEVDAIFVGAWSFHDMDAPLEVWIDDLVVDTSPVACP